MRDCGAQRLLDEDVHGRVGVFIGLHEDGVMSVVRGGDYGYVTEIGGEEVGGGVEDGKVFCGGGTFGGDDGETGLKGPGVVVGDADDGDGGEVEEVVQMLDAHEANADDAIGDDGGVCGHGGGRVVGNREREGRGGEKEVYAV